jgi:regulator of sigma E protease
MNQPAPHGADDSATGSQAGAQLPAELRLLRQGITLALVAVGLVLLFNRVGIDGMLTMALVAVGLGFVIFFHELGHFLVAKWCDVHVETFSVGFGPAIPGLSFRRGETLYKIAWFPLGGYVKMVGEGGESDEGDDDPRSFKNKTVGQRMAIISAGVTMNIILGLICFIIVYMAHGVERPPGIVGTVDAGSPAWQKGVPSGSVIRQIGSITNPYFDDLQPEVMFSSKGQKLTFVYVPPGSDKPEQTQLEPRRDEKDSRPVIGIAPASQLKFFPKRRRSKAVPVLNTSAAAEANPPFELGDTIVATTDPDHPDRLKSVDGNYFEFERRLVQLTGKSMVVQVRRQNGADEESLVDIHVPPAYHYVLGMTMRMGQITALRDKSPAVEAGVIARNVSQGVSEGDIIDQVEVTEERTGTKTRYVSPPKNPVSKDEKTDATKTVIKELDPLRLPYELQQWALRNKGPKKVTLVVLRTANHKERGQEVRLELNWDDRWRFDKEVAFSPLAPMPIPGLGLAYQIETTIEGVSDKMADGSGTPPALAAGLRPGDVIKAVRFEEPGSASGESKPGTWNNLDAGEWAYVARALQEAPFKKITLRVERGGELQECELIAIPDQSWAATDRGLILMTDLVLQKADGIGQAAKLGMQRTYYFVIQMYQSLRAIVTNRVSASKGVGGPIMIATAAYAAASDSIWYFIFFLGLISVNLAVINFLPIPILDGGHMVFLIYEKIRGIPASESARSAATIVGLAVILMLVVFTFWLDIARFF